jgi:hypothetical protein
VKRCPIEEIESQPEREGDAAVSRRRAEEGVVGGVRATTKVKRY